MMEKIDLHMHSTASDGSLTPAELAKECKRIGLAKAALTDHDTVDGVEEFLATAKAIGLDAVSGLEYNVEYDGEMHILAYGIDIYNAELREALSVLAEQRITRASRMVQKLQSQGYAITLERVEEIAGGGVLGRPHIARALMEQGYGKDIEDAFKTYLEPGKAGFLPRLKIPSGEAIRLARQAGGMTVLAHPKLTNYPDFDELLLRLKKEGLEGIEVYYPAHSDSEVEYFLALAKKYDLLITEGSDFHGKTRKSTRLGSEQRGGEELAGSVQRLFKKFID